MQKSYIKKVSLLVVILFGGFGWLYAQPAILGTTPFGGSNRIGNIFKTDLSGNNYQPIYNFKSEGTQAYGALLEVSTGLFYGMTANYGGNNGGVIFEYNAVTTVYTEKIVLGGDKGSYPPGGLIKADNGKLYGLTSGGGASGRGVLFEYDYVNEIYTKKIDLTPSTGLNPTGTLYQATNGMVYGLASYGGVNDKGTLFEYNPLTNVLTTKISFNGTNGFYPQASLTEVNGKLYGTTGSGGTQNGGTFFEYDIATGILTKKQDFTATNPNNTPLLASNGKLYGSTSYGGTNLTGTIYEYDPVSSVYSIKANIDVIGLEYGVGDLVEVTAGKLYGTTSGGGANGYGGIFEYDVATATLTKKFDFSKALGYQGNTSSFILGSDGSLYGQMPFGGLFDDGAIYKFQTTTSTYTKVHDFGEAEKVYLPKSFVETSSGRLFGVSASGGANNQGTLFEYDFITDRVIKKVDFGSVVTGEQPYLLLEASNGKLYGRSKRGAVGDRGVLFEYDIDTEAITKKINLSTTIGGRTGGMIEVDGKLYLLTNIGATSNYGSIIVYDIATGATITINHLASIGAFSAEGSPVLASNGKLYATSLRGGTTDKGTIFEYNIQTDLLTKKHDFAIATGGSPYSTLLEGLPGKLYGFTSAGGANSLGVLFEYDIATGIYTNKFSFDGLSIGGNPSGSFLKSSNGKLYAMTSTGGANGYGTFFEYDPTSNTFSVKRDLTEKSVDAAESIASLMEVCSKPKYSNIPEYKQCLGSSLTINLNSPNADSYVWKKDGDVLAGQTTGSLSWASLQATDAGQYTAEMTNVCGVSILMIQLEVSSLTNTYELENVSCNGDANGSITITTTAGDDPYEYKINSDAFSTTNSFTNLAGGTYTVTTKDVNGCEYTDQKTIIEPAVLSVTAIADVDGVTLQATGGTTPYSYSLDGATFQAEATYVLANGVYSFMVKDANECIATTTGNTIVTALEKESLNSKINIYPNPATNKITVGGQMEFSRVRIIDQTGKTVLNESIEGGAESTLSITQLTKGVYLLLLTDQKGGISKFRFMKE